MDQFKRLVGRLFLYADTSVFSFVDIYDKIKSNLAAAEYMSITSVQKENFARCFSVIASYRQIKLKTCAEDIELDQFGIDHSCCIDSDLIERITELEQETSYLKTLLQNAGIEYALSIVGGVSETEPIFVPDQGSRIIPEEITQNHVRQFYSYFWGCIDVYSKHSQNKTTGKAGYYPQCDNFWRRGVCPKVSGVKVKCKDCNNRCLTKLEGP